MIAVSHNDTLRIRGVGSGAWQGVPRFDGVTLVDLPMELEDSLVLTSSSEGDVVVLFLDRMKRKK